MKRFALLLFLTGFLPALCKAETATETPINKVAQGIDFTQAIDVSKYGQFSVQVNYSSTSATVPAASAFSDGNFSSATLTVADYAGLNGQGAYGTLLIESGKNGAALDLAVITIGSKKFIEGTNWDRLETDTATAASIQAAIDADWEYVATVDSNVVTVTYYAVGTTANSYAFTSSTQGALSCTAATLGSGQTYGYVSINGTTLTEGTAWDAETSSAATASNIMEAINDNATLSAIVHASTEGTTGVVLVQSLTAGINAYPVDVSDDADLTRNYGAFVGGVASDVDVTANTIAETSHGFSTGLALLLSTVSGTAPTGLTAETTYYAIRSTPNLYKLATTTTTAAAGTAIDITGLTGGGSFTLTPLAFNAGSSGFKWQGSNDNSNFVDINIEDLTYAADGSSLWNFTDYAYKYLRMSYTAPTTGGLNIEAVLFGRVK